MKIVFMGTPAFAAPSLEILANSSHQLLAVVTAPDKPKGRGQKVAESAVKIVAKSLGLPVLQPPKLKEPQFLEALAAFQPDLLAVVAFRILPNAVLEIPRLGAVNAHASLLPKYRGAAPIQWAIFHGEKETGISTFQIAPKVDTGGILLQEKCPIGEQDNAGMLFEKLAPVAAKLLLETIDKIEAGHLKTIPQDNALATAAPKISPEMGLLNLNRGGIELRNQIRAFAPQPGAYLFLGPLKLKIFSARFESDGKAQPGLIQQLSKKSFRIGCADGWLYPDIVQLAGRKQMDIAAFLNGFNLQAAIADSDG
ncbi:MAG TPA: methionyl-tRNA formyltransferase [Candidatus Marinimicrobia bacterium]|nr:methionyl-tRNA formyltransferase [Candidatus Neomarinimicrobiota bacterium]